MKWSKLPKSWATNLGCTKSDDTTAAPLLNGPFKIALKPIHGTRTRPVLRCASILIKPRVFVFLDPGTGDLCGRALCEESESGDGEEQRHKNEAGLLTNVRLRLPATDKKNTYVSDDSRVPESEGWHYVAKTVPNSGTEVSERCGSLAYLRLGRLPARVQNGSHLLQQSSVLR